MINLSKIKEKAFYVVGLSVSGEHIAQAMSEQNTTFFAWDDQEKVRQKLLHFQNKFVPPNKVNWENIDYLLLSPGISNDHIAAIAAKSYNVPIICDIDLLVINNITANFIGITGTNGKSTTSALIHHLLSRQKISSEIGGNIGIPVAKLNNLSSKNQHYVLELSSYQLERSVNLSTDIAVLLNLSTDHLDRHMTFTNYIDAKSNIFNHNHQCQDVVIGIDDPHCNNIYDQLKQSKSHHVLPISSVKILKNGISCVNGILYDFQQKIGSIKNNLYGDHNYQNIAAAYAVLKILNIEFKVKDLYRFKGLEHRQEICREIGNIKFINDSKATNTESCITAIKTFGNNKGNLYLIIGGVAKQDSIERIIYYSDFIRCIYLIGESSEVFASIFDKYNIEYKLCFDMKRAVHTAYKDCHNNNIDRCILLSPACASFDHYSNFNARGNDFKNIVNSILSEMDDYNE